MAHGTRINGTSYGITGGKCLVNGAAYSIKKGRTLIGGTGYDITFGTPLSAYAEGDIVYINESGSPVEFYVAKHDYESGLNGSGRTLVVRKDVYDDRAWDSSNVNAYAVSDIDTWFNGTYKSMLDATIRSLIGTTKIRYTPGAYDMDVRTLERSIFALSATELGQSASWFNVEGSALPIASTLQIAYNSSGSVAMQWTRSPSMRSITLAAHLNYGGNAVNFSCNDPSGSRPALTLPSSTVVG